MGRSLLGISQESERSVFFLIAEEKRIFIGEIIVEQ